MKLLILALSALTIACASGAAEAPAPQPAAPAQVQVADAGLTLYSGTYALQGPNRVVELRVWVDGDGKLNGELVGMGQQTVMRATATPHRFLHATSDEVAFTFTVENGRATAATMAQRGRVITGARTK